MNKYNAGEIWKAVKGESVICGRLKADELGLHLWVGDSGRTPENLESYGFTLSIIEKAAAVVVLPTKPGAYATNHGSVFVLNERHDWLDFSVWTGCVNNLAATNPAYHPFTRLEPVSETAKKVLDRVHGWWDREEHRGLPSFLSALREEFGVTK